ncbi:MAG TPA: hypothetical protein VGQ96_07315, partial [Candidatus Eremiobacteraceae bacterium]|nr:hypothetical protein [Candidatus Eremiobacteraceae bacterium]
MRQLKTFPRAAVISTQSWFLIAGAICLNLAIALPLAKILNTWIDESYTLRTTAAGVSYAIHQAIHFELQPPLYFALLALWRELDHSIFFARLFSVICAALLVYCAAQLSARYAPSLHPAWAAYVVALNPATMWAAEEIRTYALAGLLSGLLLWTFYDGYLSKESTRRARIMHALIAVISFYTQYFLSFVLLGSMLALLLLQRWAALRQYAVAMLFVGICSVPIIYALHQQIAAGTSTYFSVASLRSLVFDIYTIAFFFVMPVSKLLVPLAGVHGARYVGVAGLVAATALIVFIRKSDARRFALVAWTIPITVCIALALAFYATKEPFGYRYMFVAFMPVMLAVFVSLAELQRRFPSFPAIWMAVFVI